jgi:hypothetical protein
MAIEKDTGKVTRALYASVGAPVVAGRRARSFGSKLAGYGTKVADGFSARYDVWVEEGEGVAKQIQDRKVVGEIQEKVDIEQIQERVGKLRDQLDHTMVQWRDSFTPATKPAQPKPAPKPDAAPKTAKKAVDTKAKKPAAKKTAATTSAKKTTSSAAKKTTSKASAPKATAGKPADK